MGAKTTVSSNIAASEDQKMESQDCAWDVGPGFTLWPLHCLEVVRDTTAPSVPDSDTATVGSRTSRAQSCSPEPMWEEDSLPTERTGISPLSDLSDTIAPSPEIFYDWGDNEFFPKNMLFDDMGYYEPFHDMIPASSPYFHDTPDLISWSPPLSSNPLKPLQGWPCNGCEKKFINRKALMSA